ncbi:MAG TPA: hypothetical protein VJ180_15865 [Pyrinomonadaceae bacterium]|nr:hypothetical protein [Pyrinomonadaceae bacterium]
MPFEFFVASGELSRQETTESLHCFQPVIQLREFLTKQATHLIAQRIDAYTRASCHLADLEFGAIHLITSGIKV